MTLKHYIILLLLSACFSSFAQMTDNGITRYGNEWIHEGQLYFKVRISRDGVYRIEYNTIKNAGLPENITGSQLQLFKNGVEIPISVSSSGNWSEGDYLTFQGYYNKSEMDVYSFPGRANDIVNPKASMYSDTATYFLTINPAGNGLRTQVITNDLNNLPPAEPYIIRITELDFREILNTKTEYTSGHAYVNTPFSQGKGMVTASQNQTYNLSCPNLLVDSRYPVFRYRGVTNPGDVGINLGHDLKFYMKGQLMHNAYSASQRVLYVNFTYVDLNRVISPGDNQYTLTNSHGLDLIRTGYVAIEYPATTDIESDKPLRFYLEGSPSDRYLSFNFSGVAPDAPYLTDSLGNWRINGNIEGNTVRFRVPAFDKTQQFIFYPGNDATTVTGLQNLSINTFSNLRSKYVILSHGLLMNSTNGPSAVDQYAEYRRSAAGGGYDVSVVNVSDVYNSFGYGLDYNPMAVKNFANFLGLNGNTAFLFIIGRGRDYKEIRTAADLATAISRGYGVPTFGDYGSDNLLVSRSFSKLDMAVAVGRLPAVTQEEVLTYLNKIKASDAAYNAPGDNESRLWTKQIIQLNGGNIGQPDQLAIANSQKEAENIIKSSKIAGFVETFVKGSNETVGKASEDFFKLVNKGAAIVDYFGHGALATLEYPIDIPSKYSNNPRLPLLIIKGCKTGNCQRDGSSVPSKLLYEEGYKTTGYRAVVGSISDSELYSLSSLARQFYTLWGSTMYDKSFGELFQATFNTPGLDMSNESIQQLYIGDPALRIEPFPGPDFRVEPNSVKTDPEDITSANNKFVINFNIQNLGTSTSDTLFYTVTYENGDKKTVATQKSFLLNSKSENTVFAEFDLDKTSTVGENTIYIRLDPDNKINESLAPPAELNNEYYNNSGTKGYKFFIRSSFVEQVYPYRYAIIDTNKVTLSCFVQSLSSKESTFYWSIDTTDLFNSPVLKNYSSTNLPGHTEWTPDMAFEEGIVYYWKISRDSISKDEPAISSVSSFIYLKGKTGFSQSHNGQYRQDVTRNLRIVGGGNNLKFGTRTMIFSYGNGIVETSKDFMGLNREGAAVNSGRPFNAFSNYPTGLFGVIWYLQDSLFQSFDLGANPYGSMPVPGISGRNYLMFDPFDPDSRSSLINFIENVAREGDIITLFTYMNKKDSDLGLELWQSDSLTHEGTNIFNTLEKYGAKKFRKLLTLGNRPYTMIFSKKDGLLNEELSENYEVINNTVTTLCSSDEGTIIQNFGPAGKWFSFELLPKDSLERKDTVKVEITAIHKNNPEKNYILSNFYSLKQNLITEDLSDIDAKEYPYLRLKLYFRDSRLYKGVMDGIDFFRLVASELPEATLISNTFQLAKDSINQGDPIEISIKSKNIGLLPMDSMLVSFSIQNRSGNGELQSYRFNKLPVGGIDSYTTEFDTKAFNGNYSLIIEMNPNDNQPEAYHGNNIFTKYINIQGDVENPLVDATFDGQHIFNGDIISPKPLIKISIRDENKLFALDNPGLFNVYLVNSYGQDTLLPLTSADMKFIPADPSNLDKKNEAIIEFTPDFINYPPGYNEDGEYTIRITATDKAGNKSGKYDFEKRFRIINKKSISNVFNYPNPFSNATRFVFTLTGYELPTYYGIQIMSVSGKIVREITQDELGPLRIGKQMTNYIWDGTDEYGDKLANGVYLYRFVVKDQNKKDYEKFKESPNTNQFFTGEWGKLVIIR